MDLSILTVLTNYVPYILVIGGIFALLRLIRFFVKDAAETAIKGFEYLGFFAGIILIVTGAASMINQVWSIQVWVLLILTGLGLVLKPISKIPFAALFGLIAGLACVGLLYWFFPLPETVFGFSSIWIYLAVFLIPALIVFILFKFFEDLTKLFGMILGSWPTLSILGILCIIEAILLMLGLSLTNLL